jgi:hypothetical protein
MMQNKQSAEQTAQSFLNCSSRKDFEFLYDMFSANIYEAVHAIVESEAIAEKILTDTFITLREQKFAYKQNYAGIFNILLGIAIRFSYGQFEDSHPKKLVYQKLEKNIRLAVNLKCA